MRCLPSLIAAVLLGFLGSADAFFARDYTEVSTGCHTFLGGVGCNGKANSTLPGAIVKLWEHDSISLDDFIVDAEIINGEFKLYGCSEDEGFQQHNLEVYLEFKDVCQPGDTHESQYLRNDGFTFYKITDDKYEAEVKGFGAVEEPRKCYINAGLSEGCDFDEMMKAKFLVSFFVNTFISQSIN